MPAAGGTVGPDRAAELATGGAAAVVVETSRVARGEPGRLTVRSVSSGMGPLANVAEIRVIVVLWLVWRHVTLNLPDFVLRVLLVRQTDVVSTQRLKRPIRRQVTRLTKQVRTPLILRQV